MAISAVVILSEVVASYLTSVVDMGIRLVMSDRVVARRFISCLDRRFLPVVFR